MNGKIVISISITITIVIIAFSIIQSGEIKENPPAIEESDTMNPLLEKIKQDKIKNDNSQRFTESDGAKGEIGLLEGAQVVNTALKIIKSQKN